MRLFTDSRVRRFYRQPEHQHAAKAFETWIDTVEKAQWTSPVDVKQSFKSADNVGNNRMVFDIMGNHYRIVCEIRYTFGTVFVVFVGTRKEYDRIDAQTASERDNDRLQPSRHSG